VENRLPAGTLSCALRCQDVDNEPIEPAEPVPLPVNPEEVRRELTAAITRTATLGQAIVANLDDAEQELEEIRHGPAFRSRPET
jgi:hypothetical protein